MCRCFDQTIKTNLTADTYRRLFQQKTVFFVENIVAFWTVFWGKGGYIDVLIIKNMIKTNQIYMDVCLFQK